MINNGSAWLTNTVIWRLLLASAAAIVSVPGIAIGQPTAAPPAPASASQSASFENIESLTKAAETGDSESEYKLALALAEQESAEAVKWFKSAAEKGHGQAQIVLGTRHLAGIGVAKDANEGLRWLRRAAEQGLPAAQWMLGTAYSRGENDVPRDSREAAKWNRYAAEQGVGFAQMSLGCAYDTGDGVPQDFVLAYFWLNLAATGPSVEGRELKADEAASLDKFRKFVRDYRNAVAAKMTATQISEAQRLSRDFKPKKWDVLSKQPVTNGELDADVFGSGFFITPDGYFVTNQHVVADARRIRVKTTTGTYPARVVCQDRANDLALVKVDGTFASLRINGSAAVRSADRVFTVGYPNPAMQGVLPKYSGGDIAALTGPGDDPRLFQISLPVQPGNSGGPLVDTKGGVVGVVVGQLDKSAALRASGQLPENVNYAVKGSLVLTMLESVPELAAKIRAVSLPVANDESLVKAVESATGMILVDR